MTEHLSLLEINIGSKDLIISSSQLGDKIIVHFYKMSAFVDRWGHGNQNFSSGSQKNGNKMSVGFGRNVNDKIGMNPSRIIGNPHPQIYKTKEGSNCNIFDSYRRTIYIAYRVYLWHVSYKI